MNTELSNIGVGTEITVKLVRLIFVTDFWYLFRWRAFQWIVQYMDLNLRKKSRLEV